MSIGGGALGRACLAWIILSSRWPSTARMSSGCTSGQGGVAARLALPQHRDHSLRRTRGCQRRTPSQTGPLGKSGRLIPQRGMGTP
jgi:hypothetical protein